MQLLFSDFRREVVHIFEFMKTCKKIVLYIAHESKQDRKMVKITHIQINGISYFLVDFVNKYTYTPHTYTASGCIDRGWPLLPTRWCIMNTVFFEWWESGVTFTFGLKYKKMSLLIQFIVKYANLMHTVSHFCLSVCVFLPLALVCYTYIHTSFVLLLLLIV